MNYLIIKTIMAKKQLKIPFKDGRPCKWVKDVHDEERDNYEFDECLEIYGVRPWMLLRRNDIKTGR